MKTLARVITGIGMLLFVLLPDSTQAQGLVPIVCQDPNQCGTCEFIELIGNIISFIITFATFAATLMIVYGGFQMVTSGGNVAAKTKAKSIVVNVLIGYVLILSAFLVVNTGLGVLLPGDSPALGWRQVQCLYPTVPTQRNREAYDPEAAIDRLVAQGQYTRLAGGGGSCQIPTSGACAPQNLTCFSNAEDASRVCNLESAGGQIGVTSRTDVCEDGRSFSGGLWQINVLANWNRLPGCTGDFFETNGPSAQGGCLREVTNSNGTPYCAVRDCRITDISMYNRCMALTLDAEVNTQVACDLYSNGGWSHWITSARACNVAGGL